MNRTYPFITPHKVIRDSIYNFILFFTLNLVKNIILVTSYYIESIKRKKNCIFLTFLDRVPTESQSFKYKTLYDLIWPVDHWNIWPFIRRKFLYYLYLSLKIQWKLEIFAFHNVITHPYLVFSVYKAYNTQKIQYNFNNKCA